VALVPLLRHQSHIHQLPRAYKHVTRRTYQETFDRAAAEAGLSPELPLVRLAPTPVLL
jgi:hypothetical protein